MPSAEASGFPAEVTTAAVLTTTESSASGEFTSGESSGFDFTTVITTTEEASGFEPITTAVPFACPQFYVALHNECVRTYNYILFFYNSINVMSDKSHSYLGKLCAYLFVSPPRTT